MVNQLVFIMDEATTGLDKLLSYLNYRFDGGMWYPIPAGEWDVWGSAGPETEYGTALRILADVRYISEDVARWLTKLADHYDLDSVSIVTAREVDEYREKGL